MIKKFADFFKNLATWKGLTKETLNKTVSQSKSILKTKWCVIQAWL